MAPTAPPPNSGCQSTAIQTRCSTRSRPTRSRLMRSRGGLRHERPSHTDPHQSKPPDASGSLLAVAPTAFPSRASARRPSPWRLRRDGSHYLVTGWRLRRPMVGMDAERLLRPWRRACRRGRVSCRGARAGRSTAKEKRVARPPRDSWRVRHALGILRRAARSCRRRYLHSTAGHGGFHLSRRTQRQGASDAPRGGRLL